MSQHLTSLFLALSQLVPALRLFKPVAMRMDPGLPLQHLPDQWVR